jgi:hypothetical protein
VAIYDYAPKRIWHYLDTCQFKTFLHALAASTGVSDARSEASERAVADSRSWFMALFERVAIDVL